MNDLLLLRMTAALNRDEGRVPKLYRDSVGHPTIGVGFNLDAIGMPDAVMDLWLSIILDNVENELMREVPVYATLTPARQGALLNMAYTMGVAGVKTFVHMLAELASYDYAGAATALLASVWATEQAPQRAGRVAKQLESDTWT